MTTQAADLFNQGKVKLGGTPYLLGEVKDDQGIKIYAINGEPIVMQNVWLPKNSKTKHIKNGN